MKEETNVNGAVREEKLDLESPNNNINEKVANMKLSDGLNNLMGHHVIVETAEPERYYGLLAKYTDELDVELSYAQKLPFSDPEMNNFVLSEKFTIKSLSLKKVARLTAAGKSFISSEKGFRTDAEIASDGPKVNGSVDIDILADDHLVKWTGDEDGPMEHLDEGTKGKKGQQLNGWGVEEMFKANEDKVFGKSTYEPDLPGYQTANVEVTDRSQIEKAEKVAREIENKPESIRNARLENDDEERDLDTKTEFRQTEAGSNQSQQQRQPQNKFRESNSGGGGAPLNKQQSYGGNKNWQQQNSGATAGPGSNNWRSNKSATATLPPRNKPPYQQGGSGSGYYQQQPQRAYQPQHQNKGRYAGGPTGANKPAETNSSIPSQNPGADGKTKSNATPLIEQKRLPQPSEMGAASSSVVPQQREGEARAGSAEAKNEPKTQVYQSKQQHQSESASTEKEEPQREGSESGRDSQDPRKNNKFEFNANAMPFVPKQKDLSNAPTPAVTNTFSTTPLMSSQISNFVPLQVQMSAPAAAQLPQALPGHNLVYYPQQQPAVVQSQLPSAAAPMYAAIQPGNPPQIIYYQVAAAPNQMIFQQGMPQQHYIPISAAALPPNVFDSFECANEDGPFQQLHQFRTGTPNGAQGTAPIPQALVESATGNPLIAAQIHPTAIYAPQSQVGNLQMQGPGTGANAVPLFANNFAQLPPNMQMYRTGTPNGGGGAGSAQAGAPQQSHSQQMLVENAAGNPLIAQQQVPSFTPAHPAAPQQQGIHAQSGGVPPLLANFAQMPPNMVPIGGLPPRTARSPPKQQHHAYHRTGTPNGGGTAQSTGHNVQQQQQAPVQQHDSNGGNPLTNQQVPQPNSVYHPQMQVAGQTGGHVIPAQYNTAVPLFHSAFSHMPPNVPVAPPPFHGRQQ